VKNLRTFPVFMTMRIGCEDSIDNLLKEIDKVGCVIGNWAYDLARRIEISDYDMEVNLHVVSAEELTKNKDYTFQEIKESVENLAGYSLCPPKVALKLRLKYLDQKHGINYIIAMEPIMSSDGTFKFFSLDYCVDELRLSARHCHCEQKLLGNLFVVFMSCA
jgi:hypothetical protein